MTSFFSSFFNNSSRRKSENKKQSKRRQRIGRGYWHSLGLETLEERVVMSASPPKIVAVSPIDHSTTATSTPLLQVTFSDPMNAAAATNVNNYIIIDGRGVLTTVNSVSIDSTRKIVTVAYNGGAGLSGNDTYSLYVRGDHLFDDSNLYLSLPGQLVSANGGSNTESTVSVASDGTIGAVSNIPIAAGSSGGVSTPAAPNAVALANLNNDPNGVLDLIVVNSGTNTVSIFKGRSKAEGYGYSVTPDLTLNLPAGTSNQAKSIVVADLNGDGKLDLAVSDYNTSDVTVFLNSTPAAGGGIQFSSGHSYAAGPNPTGLVAGTFEGNSTIDLAVSNGTATTGNYTVTVLRNDGTGVFGTSGKPNVTINVGTTLGAGLQNPSSLTSGLITTGATKPDLAIGGSNGILLLKNTGATGSIGFTVQGALLAPTFSFTSVSSGTLGGGSLSDLIGTTTTSQMILLANNGNNTFTQSTVNVAKGAGGSVVIQQLTSGGNPEVLVTNGSSTDGELTIFSASGSGSTLALSPVGNPYAIAAGPGAIAVGDVDTDGKIDVVTANTAGNSASLLYGNGDGTLRVETNTPVTHTTAVQTIVGDLNGDGYNDLITINNNGAGNNSFVTVQLGLGNGQYGAAVNYSITPPAGNPLSSFVSVTLADILHNGKLDIIVADSADSEIGILINHLATGSQTLTGSSFTADFPAVVVGSNPTQVVAADLGNGHVDLIVSHNGNGSVTAKGVTVVLGNGDGTFGTATEYLSGVTASALVIGDFNGDGHPDVAVAEDVSPGVVQILNGVGDGTFVTGGSYNSGVIDPIAITAADLNNDGYTDLVVASASASPTFGGVGVLFNTFNSGFTPGKVLTVLPGTPLKSVAVDDLNLDGKPDIVATAATGGYTGDNVFAIFGNGNGTFASGAVGYNVGGNLATGNSASFVSVASDPLIRATTFTAAGKVVTVNLLNNPSFEKTDLSGETGNLVGWNTYDYNPGSGGSSGKWLTQTGTVSPLSNTSVAGATDGNFQAMLDQAYLAPLNGLLENDPSTFSGTHLLYQDVAIPLGTTAATLSLDINWQSFKYTYPFGPGFPVRVDVPFTDPSVTPALDFTQSAADTQIRVDIMDPAGNILGVTSATGVLRNEFQTGSGTAPSGSISLSDLDLTAFAGKTIRLRIAATNNRGELVVGADNFHLTTTFTDVGSPTLSNVRLQNPGFTENGIQHTTDPTIVGTVNDNAGIDNLFFIQVDPTNSGFTNPSNPVVTPLDFIDSAGNFAITIPNLSSGVHTVGIRAVDQAGNQTITTLTFNYQGATTSEFQATGPGATDVTSQADTLLNNEGVALGYNTVSGDITATVVDPADPTGNTIFVGSANGGVWKTVNGGNSWTPLTDYVVDSSGNPVPTPIGGLAIAPSNDQILYAGLGVGNLEPSSRTGNGVIKSSDGGLTWTLIGNSPTVFAGARITKMAVDNNDPTIAYAAVASGGEFGPGVYKTTDGGMTWTDVLIPTAMYLQGGKQTLPANTPLPSVTDLVIDTFDSNRVLIGLGNIGLTGALNDYAGVWLSVNKGGTWTQELGGDNATIPNNTIPGGVPPTNAPPTYVRGKSVGRVTVALGDGKPSDDRIVYVLMSTPPAYSADGTTVIGNIAPTLDYGHMLGLYKSKDNLLNFTQVQLRMNIPDFAKKIYFEFYPINVFANDGVNSGTLTVDPTDPNVVYVGGSQQYPDNPPRIDLKGSGPYTGTADTLDHAFIRVDTGNMVDTTYIDSHGNLPNNGDDITKWESSYNTSGGHSYPKAEPIGSGETYYVEGVYWYDILENQSGDVGYTVTATGNFGLTENLPDEFHSLTFDEQGRLLIGSNGGIWRGYDRGFSYDFSSGGSGPGQIIGGILSAFEPFFSTPGMSLTALNGNLQIADLTSVAIDPHNPGVYFTTAYDTGSSRSLGLLSYTSNGITGPTTEDPNNPGTVYVDPFENAGIVRTAAPAPNEQPGTPTTAYEFWQNTNYLTFNDYSSYLAEVSTDGGKTFIAKPRSGISVNDRFSTGYFASVAVSPYKVLDSGVYEDEILVGSNKVYLTRTTDNVYDAISPVLTKGIITALAFTNTDGYYYAGSSLGEVFVTTNNGVDQWGTKSSGLPAFPINAITSDPNNRVVAYVGYGGGAGHSHLFRTADGGKTYTDISATLPPGLDVTSIAIDPTKTAGAPNGKLFVGTEGGLYVSYDSGTTFHRLGVGLPNAPVVDIQYSAKFGTIAAAVEGRGVWTIAVNDIGPRVVSIASPTAVGQATVTITFAKAIDPSTLTTAEIGLYNPLGQAVHVTSIVNVDTSTNTTFQISFNSSGAVTGAYKLVVGPTVGDFDGNLMDQNQNGIQGENPADDFVGRFIYLAAANHAPVLGNATETLTAILENAFTNVGVDLPTLIKGLNITDVDPNALQGVAITAADVSNGDWQYSRDGGVTWSDLAGVSLQSARLLESLSTDRVRFVPNQYFFGTTTITVRAWDLTTGLDSATGSDGGLADTTLNGGTSAFSATTSTITLPVTNVNQPPSFFVGANQNVLENSSLTVVNNWATSITAGPNEDGTQQVNFIVTTNNPSLFSTAPTVTPTGTLSFQPAHDQFGTAIVSVQLHDNGGTANGGIDTSPVQQFTITVAFVNQPPTFTPGPNEVSAPVSTAVPVSTVWATNISAGPPNESGFSTHFNLTYQAFPQVMGAAFFSVPPKLDNTGILSYTLAPNAHGYASVTVTLQNSGGTANGGQDTSAPVTFYIAAVNSPTLAQLSDITVAGKNLPVTAQLQATQNDIYPLTYSATAYVYNPAYELTQQLDLQSAGDPSGKFYQNYLGLNEKWLLSANGSNPGKGAGYYVVLPDGEVRPWLGGRSTGQTVGTVDVSYYNDPTLFYPLFGAARTLAPSNIVVSVNSSGLISINESNFVGTFLVKGTATDGFTTPSTLFKVTVTDNGPTLAPVSNQVAKHTSLPLTVQLQATETDATNPVSYTASLVGYNALYNLEQQLKLTPDPLDTGHTYYYNDLGLGEKWLVTTNANSGAVGGYYVILPDGEVRPWLGGKLTGASVGTVTAAVYNDPTQLTNALNAPPPVAPADVGISVSSSGLITITNSDGQYTGTFQVNATVSDGFVSSQQTFLVTVNNDAPQVSQITDRTVSSGVTGTVQIHAGDAEGDTLTYTTSVSGYNLGYNLQQVLDLQDPGDPANQFYLNYLGLNEKWLLSANGSNSGKGENYYVILPDGEVRPWLGGSKTGATVGTIETTYYTDPTQLYNLFNATPPAAPTGVTTSVNSTGLISIVTPAAYTGTFRVNYTVSDGVNTTTQSFLTTAVNNTPQPGALGNQSLSHGGFPLTLTLPTHDASNNALTYPSAAISGYTAESNAEALFGLKEDPADRGTYYYNFLGLGEKWLLSNNNSNPGAGANYFVVLPDGSIRPWLGGSSTGQAVATVSTAAYTNPTLITSATPPPNPTGVTASLSSNVLTVNAPSTFNGTFKVTVFVTDNGVSTSESFLVNVADDTELLEPIANQTVKYNTTSFTVPVVTTDAEGDTVSVSAVATGYNPQYDAKQLLALVRDPLDTTGNYYYNSLGLQEKWLVSTNNSNPGAGANYYVILPDGEIRPWLGGKNTGATVATVTTAAYADPTLIINAVAPSTPVGVSTSLSGSTLTVNNANGYVGTFRVTLTANDGNHVVTSSFLVTTVNNAPVLPAIGNQSVASGSLPLTLHLKAQDSEGDTVTYTAAVQGYSAAYDAEQLLSLQFAGQYYQNALGIGLQEKWLRSTTSNLSNGGWYVILQDGEVRAWLGGSNTSATVANVGTAGYADPSTIYSQFGQPAPSAPSGVTVMIDSNGQLVINDASYLGTFRVIVTARDAGHATPTSVNFLVTVH